MDFEEFLSKRFGDNWNNVFTDGMKALSIELMTAAYNQALEDAAEKAKTTINSESTSIIVDKQSILSLKKQ